ncbi:MAG: hypothetical protein ABSE46_23500 [Terracidiphilus sp.]
MASTEKRRGNTSNPQRPNHDMKAASQESENVANGNGSLIEAEPNRTGNSNVVALDLFLMGHPVDIHWDDVIDLISKIGRVSSHIGRNFVFEVNGKRASFTRPIDDVVPDFMISELRKLLEEAEGAKLAPPQFGRTIVVIDHHAARIYQLAHGANSGVIMEKPADPHGYHRHLIHRREAHYEGERVPEDNSYFERVAHEIAGAETIIIIGHGHGKSNEGDLLLAYLHKHHAALGCRVLAVENRDFGLLSDAQIEAELRI